MCLCVVWGVSPTEKLLCTGSGTTPSLLSSPEGNNRTPFNKRISQRVQRYFIIIHCCKPKWVFFVMLFVLSVFLSESNASNTAMSAAVQWVCSCRPVAAVVRSFTVARPAKQKRGMSATETSVSVCQVGTRSQSTWSCFPV